MEELEKELWRKVDKYLKYLKFVPFLRLAAVCNNLAFGTVDPQSDIDLFIIAKNGRLFTVRLFTTFILQILGVRRHGDKIAGRFCLSFYVDDSFLDLSKIAIENDVYLAYWAKTMKPVIDDGVEADFLPKNQWLRKYFEDFDGLKLDNEKLLSSADSYLRKIFEWILVDGFGAFIENLLKNWQLKRAREKAKSSDGRASLFIDDHILKFHNLDRRKYYRDLWIERFGTDKLLTDADFKSLF